MAEEKDTAVQNTAVANSLPIFLFVVCVIGLAVLLLVLGNLFSPGRKSRVKFMPYESGMDPIHDTRRRFDVRFYLVAVAFLVFDVELLFLYPWAVTAAPGKVAAIERPDSAAAADARATGESPQAVDPTVEALRATPLCKNRDMVFPGVMVFIALLTLGFIYDWRKGIFQWR